MFSISDQPIKPFGLGDSRAGGVAIFEGLVRNHNENKPVDGLEYEAYTELAEIEGNKIIEEAKQRFDIRDIKAVHRVGHLAIGDVAIRVEASAEHRQAAFEACEYAVEEIKHRVPIWKREAYSDGSGEWLKTESASQDDLTEAEQAFHCSQISHIQQEGQLKLKGAEVLVVGVGSLGCSAATNLARAGVGRIIIVDHAAIELEDLSLQTLFTTNDLGRRKPFVAAERIRQQNPWITVKAIEDKVTSNNANDLANGASIILDCSNDQETTLALNASAAALNIPLVHASSSGSQQNASSWTPNSDTGCLYCQAQEPKQSSGCISNGTLGMIGALQAWETLRVIIGEKGPLNHHRFVFNLSTLESELIPKRRLTDCPVCGSIESEIMNPTNPIPLLITSRADLAPWTVVDVRKPENIQSEPISEITTVSCPDRSIQKLEGYKGQKLLAVCELGVSSLHFAEDLREQGHEGACALVGGFDTLQKLLAQQS